jgi:two-component system, NtrC family, nitrogen regulation sensor histidine kinase GlnL
MTQAGYAFLGLTVIVAGLAAVLVFAMLRLAAGARDARRHLSERSSEAAFLSAALQEAVTKMRAQEKAMTARAAASEQLSGDIVESLTAGLLVVDRSGRVEIFNRAGRQMIGVKSDPVGFDYHEVLASFPPLVQLIGECLSTARPIVRRSVQIEGSGPTHLGVTVSPLGRPLPHVDHAEATSAPPKTSEPALAAPGVICLFSDLTSVVELEEQLRLKETLARLGELTAGLAHEFRNGLATIHGYSKLIDVQTLEPKHRQYIEGIRQEAQALGKVVTNFLSFARPENVALSPVDLGVVVRRAADDLRHELPADASLSVDGIFADVLGDEVLLRQVFGNLVRNALDACEGAGVKADIRIRGWVDPMHRSCRVSVDDNGPGIPESTRERIFQPFFTTRSQGTGLGLAIVQKIVVMHNGRVAVHDARGGGASIQISIPTVES